jgi:hypothetical protein
VKQTKIAKKEIKQEKPIKKAAKKGVQWTDK